MKLLIEEGELLGIWLGISLGALVGEVVDYYLLGTTSAMLLVGTILGATVTVAGVKYRGCSK